MCSLRDITDLYQESPEVQIVRVILALARSLGWATLARLAEPSSFILPAPSATARTQRDSDRTQPPTPSAFARA